jgi:NAD(P)H-dependent FMN reductase
MIHVSRVLVIIGSVRAQRVCPQVAHWVAQTGRETIDREFEVVDLKDWPLPMDDEPGIPAVHDYVTEQTNAWSKKISEAGAVVLVTPQYNWGYPAALKNAIDHLYKEWSGKPVMIVSYGSRGGGRCAKQLRQVLKGMHAKLIPTMPGFRLTKDRIKANSGAIEPERVFAKHRKILQRAFNELDAALGGRRFASWLRWRW